VLGLGFVLELGFCLALRVVVVFNREFCTFLAFAVPSGECRERYRPCV